MKRCPNCHTVLPNPARFCFHCGQPQDADWTGEVRPLLNLHGDIEQQLFDYFMSELKDRVQREQDGNQWRHYLTRFNEVDYPKLLERQFAQLAQRLGPLAEVQQPEVRRINNSIEQVIDEFINRFLFDQAADLNKVPIPDAVLRYRGKSLEEVDFYEMFLAFLRWDQEPEDYYTDYFKMSQSKARNASRRFFQPEKTETTLVICDTSLLGNGREGFALTDRALYWRASLQPPRVVPYYELATPVKEEGWILINDHYFHVNRSMDLKMVYLIKQLVYMYREE